MRRKELERMRPKLAKAPELTRLSESGNGMRQFITIKLECNLSVFGNPTSQSSRASGKNIDSAERDIVLVLRSSKKKGVCRMPYKIKSYMYVEPDEEEICETKEEAEAELEQLELMSPQDFHCIVECDEKGEEM